jgi:hypothetical protein
MDELYMEAVMQDENYWLEKEFENQQLINKKRESMKNLGKKVIVRADRAGVFFGTLTEKEGSEVVLTNARKLFYWNGAAAVEQIAVDGVNKQNDCKFTVVVEEITILNVIQIIPCTEKAIANIENVKEWKL